MMVEKKQDVAQAMAALPALDPFLGTLPPNQFPYRATLSDVHELFVVNAPYREARQLIFNALSVYSERIWSILPHALLWIDGGFATHKDWEAPHDVDVAVVVDQVDNAERALLATNGLLTLATVEARIGEVALPVIDGLRPMGGLVDAYLVTSATRDVYRMQWSRVRGPDREIMPDVLKGFLEVARGIS